MEVGNFNFRGKPMPISKKYKNVIDLADYRKKAVPYPVDTMPEFPSHGDIDELVRQGRWRGTYTPQSPYGKKEQEFLQSIKKGDRLSQAWWERSMYLSSFARLMMSSFSLGNRRCGAVCTPVTQLFPIMKAVHPHQKGKIHQR